MNIVLLESQIFLVRLEGLKYCTCSSELASVEQTGEPVRFSPETLKNAVFLCFKEFLYIRLSLMPLSFLISFQPSIYVSKCSNARGLAKLGLALQPTGINFFSANGISRNRRNASVCLV